MKLSYACARGGRVSAGAVILRQDEERDVAAEHIRANLQPLSLHVPEPKFRPGDTVDFAAVDVPPAGAQRRPDTA
ncbi:hypothetical protein, partial [Klebsiella pneumoniae]